MSAMLLRDIRRGYAGGGAAVVATHQPLALPGAQALALGAGEAAQ